MTENPITPGYNLVVAAIRGQMTLQQQKKKNPNLFFFIKVIIDWLKAKLVTNRMGMSVTRLD